MGILCLELNIIQHRLNRIKRTLILVGNFYSSTSVRLLYHKIMYLHICLCVNKTRQSLMSLSITIRHGSSGIRLFSETTKRQQKKIHFRV